MPRRVAPTSALLAGCLLLPPPAPAQAPRPDLVVADFEGDAYGPGWVATGTAFGPGPARGTLPGQMSVDGFEGRGLVNSFNGGDDAEGTLTSPPFRVERRYLNFLLGGGREPDLLQVALVVDGAIVRTATGPNDRPGGSERLDWATWDVADLAGKEATLRITDRRKGGWGHISVDSVAQADARRQAEPATRAIAADRRYLHLPVDPKAPTRRVRVTSTADGAVVRDFDIRLGADPAAPGAFAAFLDLAPFRGQALRVEAVLPPGSPHLDALVVSDELPDQAHLYRERDRPQFHFTSRRGWLNDPNGMVWHRGQYHLFYQHNPYGWDWGNMHWGHATSPDLVHWSEQPIALYPRKYGDWAFSGSAVVDHKNTSGFGTADDPPLVAAYTSTGRGECIVSSRDGGRTWQEFAGNPVVRHEGRDPRLLWHAPTSRWIMALYDEADGKQAITFHSSPDLKAWTYESRIDGFFECPDLFELPVRGAEPARSLWVLSAADGRYRLGRFDGHEFTPETDKLTLWHGDFYAAQTFSDAPDGRRIQIGWGRDITFPGMPFNQQMAVPCELTLRATPDGPRLFAEPVAELARIRAESEKWQGIGFGPGGQSPDEGLPRIEHADGVDLTVDFWGQVPGGLVASWHGAEVRYDGDRRVLSVAGLDVPLAPGPLRRFEGADKGGPAVANKTPLATGPVGVKLRILGDRRSLEVFANDGRVAVSRRIVPKEGVPALRLTTEVHPTLHRSIELRVAPLKSAW